MSQIIIKKRGACESLFPFLIRRGVKRVLLVCDPAFYSLKMREDFKKCPVEYTVFDGFRPNPRYEDVCRGVEAFRERGCDGIVAVGGGSALDVAKCIKLFSALEPGVNYLEQTLRASSVPLAAVPTTSGTGSESTRFAVIYYQGVKQSISSPAAIPDLAVLDADVLDTLPVYQKKCTMSDALCQGVEAWWSVHSTARSRELSRRAVEGVMRAMDGYLKNDPEKNEEMLAAANLAGQAINIAQTTAAHAMSYKLTSLFGVPHGRAVACCLPHVWRYMLEHPERCVDARGGAYLKGVFEEIAGLFGCKDAADAPGFLSDLFGKVFRDERPAEFQQDKLELLVESVNPVRLGNNPVELSRDGIRGIYRRILNYEFSCSRQ